METQEERVIKHHRWLLLLQEQAVLLTKKRIEERNRYLAKSNGEIGYRNHNVYGRASERD